jgi:hypothetical protein
VSLSDGFKCTRCDYADACDDRVEKYKRVGRLIVEPKETDESMNEPQATETRAESDQPNNKRQKKEATSDGAVVDADALIANMTS